LVEFSDYECPFCARHSLTVAPIIKKEFIDTGKVRHVFVNNPLPFHSHAHILALAALCAGEQKTYWEMHDVLFQKKPIETKDIATAAESLGLNVERFQHCVERSPEGEERINKDIQVAKDLKLTATPSFAIGVADSAGRAVLKRIIVGAQPAEIFSKELNATLSSPKKG